MSNQILSQPVNIRAYIGLWCSLFHGPGGPSHCLIQFWLVICVFRWLTPKGSFMGSLLGAVNWNAIFILPTNSVILCVLNDCVSVAVNGIYKYCLYGVHVYFGCFLATAVLYIQLLPWLTLSTPWNIFIIIVILALSDYDYCLISTVTIIIVRDYFFWNIDSGFLKLCCSGVAIAHLPVGFCPKTLF